jgi:hypothetical protein
MNDLLMDYNRIETCDHVTHYNKIAITLRRLKKYICLFSTTEVKNGRDIHPLSIHLRGVVLN